MSEERKINGMNDFLQISMTNNMPLSVNEKRQIFDLIINLQTQLQQKETIIKEVREYIEEKIVAWHNSKPEVVMLDYDKIIEILDKVGSEKIE